MSSNNCKAIADGNFVRTLLAEARSIADKKGLPSFDQKPMSFSDASAMSSDTSPFSGKAQYPDDHGIPMEAGRRTICRFARSVPVHVSGVPVHVLGPGGADEDHDPHCRRTCLCQTLHRMGVELRCARVLPHNPAPLGSLANMSSP